MLSSIQFMNSYVSVSFSARRQSDSTMIVPRLINANRHHGRQTDFIGGNGMQAYWKSNRCKAALCASLALAAPHTFAAEPAGTFPSRTVTLVVGFSPGGLPDIAARLLAPALSDAWKQQVIVENRPGAGSAVAARMVATGNADGHTILSTTAAHSAAPALYAKLGYDPAADFSGVALVGTTPLLLVTGPNSSLKTLADLIAQAKAKPGFINFASAGVGSNTHFGMEVFNSTAGIEMTHVPYKGIPEALTDIMTGRVEVFAAPLGNALAPLRDSRLRALAVTKGQRTSLLPDVPTVAESGIAYRWDTWFGLLVSSKTPRAIVMKLNADIMRILEQPSIAARWAALGAEVPRATPEQFDQIVRDDIATFTRSARAAKIQPE